MKKVGKLVLQLETLPVIADQLKNATHYDPVLAKYYIMFLTGGLR